MEIKALIIAIVAGLFFLVGYLLSAVGTNKNQLFKFSSAMAFMVIFGLIAFDLAPELIENLKLLSFTSRLLFTFVPILGGFFIIRLIDLLVPHHHHDHHDDEHNYDEHKANLFHIGVVTSIALVLHNIIEGSAIYLTSLTDIKSGLLIMFGVGLHNVPLGIEIVTSLNFSERKFSKKIIPILLLTLSTGLGALFMFAFNMEFSPLMYTILIGVTVGMLLYILFMELAKEVISSLKNKGTILGLILGTLIVVVSLLM